MDSAEMEVRRPRLYPVGMPLLLADGGPDELPPEEEVEGPND